MPQLKGRIVKPPTIFIDNVAIDLDEGGAWGGRLELPVGAVLQPNQSYRLELYDGRAGEVLVTSYNEISTKGEFRGVGPLA